MIFLSLGQMSQIEKIKREDCYFPFHFVQSPGPVDAAVLGSWLRHRLVFRNTFERPPTSSEQRHHLEESAKQFHMRPRPLVA